MTGTFQTMQPGTSPKPGVLAVIPCLNEAAHIEAIARQVLQRGRPYSAAARHSRWRKHRRNARDRESACGEG